LEVRRPLAVAARRAAFASLLAVILGCTAGAPWPFGPGGGDTPAAATNTPEPTVGPTPTPGPDATCPPPDVLQTIMRVEGNATLTTPAFEVDGSWTIAWRNEGSSLFSIQLVPVKVDTFGELLVSTVEPGRGTMPMFARGRFVLRIVGSDPWQVTLKDYATELELPLPGVLAGRGATNTPAFWTRGPWLFEWRQDRARSFAVERVDLADGQAYEFVRRTKARWGCTTSPAVGHYYLRIVTDGSWHLRLSPWDGAEVVCPT
jgi:hypothetical protein